MKIIEIKNLSCTKNKKRILNNINISFDSGSITSIIGPSGSGKSTLLKMIAGILPNDHSIIYNYGYVNDKKNNNEFTHFGYSSSDCKFLFNNVYDELSFSLENLCLDKEIIIKRLKDITSYFDVTYLLDKKIDDLKQYEKEIVSFLVSIVHLPKVLILDQVFLSLTRDMRKMFLDKIFRFVKEKQMTLIISSSNLEDILFTDFTYVLNNGEIVMEGDTLDVLENDVPLKKIGLRLPFMVDLSLMFKFYEILDDVYLDMDDVVNKLWK